ncbi:hypothetical protein EOD42_02910 [Rhodovarius crocodyli]|uniref:Uncharacterized protein n=1 Tax=Rhodovarius crocodyli TaxID=1979269 RepID=A0A437MN56_9PROT|nr:hypothetical protein [Rhodovarius crocodyli]RVT99073.1 hypothetical protein EOD42_02910 [Rhodovarius crocodyli]
MLDTPAPIAHSPELTRPQAHTGHVAADAPPARRRDPAALHATITAGRYALLRMAMEARKALCHRPEANLLSAVDGALAELDRGEPQQNAYPGLLALDARITTRQLALLVLEVTRTIPEDQRTPSMRAALADAAGIAADALRLPDAAA